MVVAAAEDAVDGDDEVAKETMQTMATTTTEALSVSTQFRLVWFVLGGTTGGSCHLRGSPTEEG